MTLDLDAIVARRALLGSTQDPEVSTKTAWRLAYFDTVALIAEVRKLRAELRAAVCPAGDEHKAEGCPVKWCS